jgi:hypothetical protein
MARQESDRDDLFAELAALTPRMELRTAGPVETVFAGRRESTGGWSLFFGPDRVYHFDASGRLRRAYMDGFLYRSEGSTLSRLHRERSTAETSLLRHDLEIRELQAFLDVMFSAIRELVRGIQANSLRVVRVMPDDADALPMLAKAMDAVLDADPPLAPAIRS